MTQILTQTEASFLKRIDVALKNTDNNLKKAIEVAINEGDDNSYYYEQAVRHELKHKGIISYDEKYEPSLHLENAYVYNDDSYTTYSKYNINDEYSATSLRETLISNVYVPEGENKKEYLLNSIKQYGIVNSYTSVYSDIETPDEQKKIFYILPSHHTPGDSEIITTLKEQGDNDAIIHNCFGTKPVIDISESELPPNHIEGGTGFFIEAFLDKGYVNEKSLEILNSNTIDINVLNGKLISEFRTLNKEELWKESTLSLDEVALDKLYNDIHDVCLFEKTLIKNIDQKPGIEKKISTPSLS